MTAVDRGPRPAGAEQRLECAGNTSENVAGGSRENPAVDRDDAVRREFLKMYSRGDAWSADLASRAYLAHRRSMDLMTAERHHAAAHYASAPRRFLLQRAATIEKHERELLEKPFEACLGLLATRDGIDRLRARLDELDVALGERRWGDREYRLLRALACEPDWSDFSELRRESDRLIAALAAEEEGEIAAAERDLRERIEGLRDDLADRFEELEGEEEESRALFIAGSAVDTSREGMALMRAIEQANNLAFRLMREAGKLAESGRGRAGSRSPLIPTAPPVETVVPRLPEPVARERTVRADGPRPTPPPPAAPSNPNPRAASTAAAVETAEDRIEARRRRPPSPMEKKKHKRR